MNVNSNIQQPYIRADRANIKRQKMWEILPSLLILRENHFLEGLAWLYLFPAQPGVQRNK